MQNATQTLDQQFLEMRWRCLSLAADLDRVQRAAGGPELMRSDARLQALRDACSLLTDPKPSNRAEQVQMIFSDRSATPSRASRPQS